MKKHTSKVLEDYSIYSEFPYLRRFLIFLNLCNLPFTRGPPDPFSAEPENDQHPSNNRENCRKDSTDDSYAIVCDSIQNRKTGTKGDGLLAGANNCQHLRDITIVTVDLRKSHVSENIPCKIEL